jgi:2-polyprenyl-6-hydroxyphenyl methylase/3-demethylubiquinone-9 3-methyltransferase
MLAACLVPIALQAVAMAVDEGWFHRRRGLPRWERIGHPLDTATIALGLGWLLITTPRDHDALAVYLALAIGSTLFVTKDEPVHALSCTPGEHWLHAVLFALHPIVLAAFGVLWWTGHAEVLAVQLAVVLAFLAYQAIYWNVVRARASPAPSRVAAPAPIDNAWYAALGERWYAAADTPIALLRAESRHRNPWIADEITRTLGPGPRTVLDLGCGGGFLSNYLATRGHAVTGLDNTPENLTVARAHDRTGTVTYTLGDACALPFADASFDVVCAMDLIEHVEEPERLIAEVGRVLAPGGLFFFHTFNRTWLANLIVIKGVTWFVKNAPRALHVLRLFRTPDELARMCRARGLAPAVVRGVRPRFGLPLLRMMATGEVGDDFAFTFARSTAIGYTGYARRGPP